MAKIDSSAAATDGFCRLARRQVAAATEPQLDVRPVPLAHLMAAEFDRRAEQCGADR